MFALKGLDQISKLEKMQSTLDKFDLSNIYLDEKYQKLFKLYGMFKGSVALNAIELYNVIPRDTLILYLRLFFNSNNINVKIVNLLHYKRMSLSQELKDIESMLDVLLEYRDKGKITVICSINNSTNAIKALNLLYAYDVSFKFVTDTNMRELQLGASKLSKEFNHKLLTKLILMDALQTGASDVHFLVEHYNGVPHHVIKMRYESLKLYDRFTLSKKDLNAIITFLFERTNTNEADLDYNGAVGSLVDFFGDGSTIMRVTGSSAFRGKHAVVRIQDLKSVPLTMDKLGFDEQVLDDLNLCTKKCSGLTLVTGAVRTGKNTTLNAMTKLMAKKPIKIVEYTEPVEFLQPYTQFEYYDDIDKLVSYIKLAKKQDIDNAVLNEIPDQRVAFAVRDLVNSSVYVLTTLHIDRLWDLPYKLEELYGGRYKDMITRINGVFNQKMCYKICPECRQKMLVTNLEDNHLRKYLLDHSVEVYYKSYGCDKCNSGVSKFGFRPICESLIFTEELKDKLRICNQPHDMQKVLRDYLRNVGNALEGKFLKDIENGIISPESLYQII